MIFVTLDGGPGLLEWGLQLVGYLATFATLYNWVFLAVRGSKTVYGGTGRR